MTEGASGRNIWVLDYTPIHYAHRYSYLLLDHLLLEEGTLITWFFISFIFLGFAGYWVSQQWVDVVKWICGTYLEAILPRTTGKNRYKGEKRNNERNNESKRRAEMHVMKLRVMNIMANLWS